MMTLRWRLTLIYGTLLWVILLLAGLGGYISLRNTLYLGLDDHLRASATHLADQMRLGLQEPPLEVRVVLDVLNREQAVRLTVFNLEGGVVDWGPSRVGFLALEGSRQVGHERVFTLPVYPKKHPIPLEPSQLEQGEHSKTQLPTSWIQASRSDSEVQVVLSRMLRVAVLGVPLLLLVALGLGWLVVDRGLKPVDQVSELAARIARSAQPSERVPQAPGSDELAKLTRTFNEMLSRLEMQLTRERMFAHASAHELRTPLSVIRATASLALERDRSLEEYCAALVQVREVSGELAILVSRLLTLARPAESLELKPINLADIALLIVELYNAEAQTKGITLEITLEDAPVLGDAVALALAAGNLLQNAVKYSLEGTTIWVSSGRLGTRALLTVQDAGPGLPEADMQRLLQPFQRGLAASGSSGAGLGLALVQTIVDAQGGSLELTNHPQGGLRACLILNSTA